ncbi:hypothetical protein FKM82_021673 [Ascaphus truei]
MESPLRHGGLASFGPLERIILIYIYIYIYLFIKNCMVFQSGDKSPRKSLALFNVNAQGGRPIVYNRPPDQRLSHSGCIH